MKTALISFVALCALLFVSCNSDPLTVSAPERTGTLWGPTYLYTSYGATETDHRGVTVTAEGSSISSTTDSTGRWRLEKLPAGSYTLTFTKPGYGTQKIFGYQFVGNGETFFTQNLSYYNAIVALPDYTIDRITLSPTDNVSTPFDLQLEASSTDSSRNYLSFVAFFGLDSNVSAEEGHSYWAVDYSAPRTGGKSSRVYTMPFGTGWAMKPAGTIVYMVVYGNTSKYYNPKRLRYEFTGLSSTPSNVIKFVVQ